MALCLMVNCGNKTGKKSKTEQGIKCYRVPAVITDEGELIEVDCRKEKKMDICDKQRRFDREKTV